LVKAASVKKVVAITGGAQGIGRGIAHRFAEAGYFVSIADPVQDAAMKLSSIFVDKNEMPKRKKPRYMTNGLSRMRQRLHVPE
jgi:NAD(P)-dependent dehydrogenase (short-subunit alcohol dehydrogenase family)